MKKFILNLIFILIVSFWGYSQTGAGYLNYRAVRTHSGNGTIPTEYGNYPANSTQFDAMFDLTNPANTLIGEGEVIGNSAQGTNGGKPPGVSGNYFAVEYKGWFLAKASGSYTFYIYSDDAAEVWIGDTKVAGRYFGSGSTSGQITLEADTWYPLMTRYQEFGGSDYLIVQVYSSMFQGYYNLGDANRNYPVSNIPPVTTPTISLHYDVNFKFGTNINPSTFTINTHHRVSEQEIAKNSTSNSIGLDSNGEATITSQIDETLVGQGKYDITATPGNVEWVVIYSPMVTNKYKYRIGLDVREFPSGVDLDDINNIELLDLVDTDGTSTAFESTFNNSWATTTSDQYWNNFNFYIWNPIPFSSSNYSSSIRSASGYHALKVELNFTEVTAYKTQYVVFDSPNNLQSLVDDIITVSDVYLGFNELSNSGIGMNESGNEYDYGIQYTNSDINRDGQFDFQDTYMMMDFLNGGTLFDTSYLAAVMRLTKTSEYNSISSTNWNGYTTQTMYPLNLNTTDTNYDIDVSVSWLGDVNLSHSPTPTNNLSVTGKSSVIRKTNKDQTSKVDGILDIQLVNNTIEVTLKVNSNQEILKGTQFRLSFDDSILTFDKIQTTAKGTPFHSKRTSYINFGSIITNDDILDGTTEYKLIFNSSEELTSILGLVSLTKTEVISESGEQMKVYIK